MKGMVFWEWGFKFWFLVLKDTPNNLKSENGAESVLGILLFEDDPFS